MSLKNRSGTNFQDGSNTDLDCYLEAYHDKYFYEFMSKFEKQLIGNKVKNDENLIIDISVEFAYPVQIQFYTSEPSKPYEATS